MPQANLSEYVEALDRAGLLRRYVDEKRVDELPLLMEENPDQAILVEHIKDSPFPFFANGYASRAMYALSLECDPKDVSAEISKRSDIHYKAQLVGTAPCKDVILHGDDVDLTVFPLFQHHPKDGHAFFCDTRIIARHPDTGLTNDGIMRMMYRSKNTTNLNTAGYAFHASATAAMRYHQMGKDMPFAVCIGGPTLDKISSMMRRPGGNVDCWDKLGGFLGGPAKIVKCETNDLMVPVNAEIVLEGRVISSEGMVHDEGPFGEFPGTYGNAIEVLAHNMVAVIDCITYRRGAIYQYATVGGLHPGRTDMYAFQLAIEGELFDKLQQAGIQVRDVVAPADGGGNIAYAQIKAVSGGDSMQTLGIMLTGCRQFMPKLAYVFDEDVDIHNDTRVKWAQAFRYNPAHGTLVIPGQNTQPLDPSIRQSKPPFSVTKIGFDCTMGVGADPAMFEAAVVSQPIAQPPTVPVLSEETLLGEMSDYIRQAPRLWKDILDRFAGQPYPIVYRAFGKLRPKLGRMMHMSPFPYTFSDHGDFVEGTN